MFINDLPKRQLAEAEIGTIASDQMRRLEAGEFTGREMITACRRILDLWVDTGGASTDDEVIGVLGIESQCDHVMLRPGQQQPRYSPDFDNEDAEIDRLGEFFRDGFASDMRNLAERYSREV
jgi:hypothetical protein